MRLSKRGSNLNSIFLQIINQQDGVQARSKGNVCWLILHTLWDALKKVPKKFFLFPQFVPFWPISLHWNQFGCIKPVECESTLASMVIREKGQFSTGIYENCFCCKGIKMSATRFFTMGDSSASWTAKTLRWRFKNFRKQGAFLLLRCWGGSISRGSLITHSAWHLPTSWR